MLKMLLVGALLLSGCAPMRPAPPSPLHAVPVGLAVPAADSLPAVAYPAEDRAGLDRASNLGFFGRWLRPRKPKAETLAVAPGTAVVLPRKMRGSQVTVVIGNANDTRATAQGKVKAPNQVATDSSTQNAVMGGGDLAAANGAGSTASPTHTETAAPGPLATIAAKLAGPPGVVLGGVVLAGVLYGLYYFWFLIPRRKSQPQA